MEQHGEVHSRVGYQLKRAQTALRSRMDEALLPLGLTTPQYSCLEALSHNPGASNSDLARAVFVTRQTMNTLLHSLENRGLIKRASKATKGRTLPTYLTDDGQKLLAQAAQIAKSIEAHMVSMLTDNQINALHDALSECADALITDPP